MSTPVPVPVPVPTNLSGLKELIMGPAGTGKTYSLATMVEAGIKCFYLGMEPGLESLLGYWKDVGKPVPPNLHWHQLAAPTLSFTDMIASATKVNSYNLESLAKMQDPDRMKHNQFIKLLETLANFKDERTGTSFGGVDSWGPDKALFIDSMTGINNAAMSMVVGGKPVKSQSDWGIAQDQTYSLIRKLTQDCKCHLVIIAHVEREVDLILGGVKLMVASLGKALAPKLPPLFSDVILSVRQGDKWVWDTASVMADVKTRNLPIKADNAPDFRPIINKWKTRGAVA